MPSYYPQELSYPQEIMNENSMLISTFNLYRNPNMKKPLPPSFQPGPSDVICARGKQAYDHIGNRRFRHLVKLHQENYAAAVCKYQKSKIVSHIVNTVRHLSPEGGFVKLIKGVWHEVGDRAAKEKIGQTFRDLLHTKYSSSTKAKARARIQHRIEEYESGKNHHSGQESSESGESDDDSVEKGLYPSFSERCKLPSRIEIVKSEPENTQAQKQDSTPFTSEPTQRAPQQQEQQEQQSLACDIEPLSLGDDSIGNIDSLAQGDVVGRRRSSCFAADMKVFADFMGVAV